MKRRLLLALPIAMLFAPLAVAQPKPGDPKEETAETIDGVKLSCRFYKAVKQGNNSCAILLHDYNADPSKGDWDGLARFLAVDCGINVMRFDFRGHGQSTSVIADKFWKESWNQRHVSGYNRRPTKTEIEVKDFKPDYYPMLVNDIAAVRMLLDQKNDDRQVNTRTIYIIASGSAAPLANLFLATEWSRPAVKPAPVGVFGQVQNYVNFGTRRTAGTEVAGKDYAGLVLLTPTRNFTYPRGNQTVKSTVNNFELKNWVSKYSRDTQGGGDLRNTSGLVVMFGDKDDDGLKQGDWFYNDLMNADAKHGSSRLKPMSNSKLIPIKGAKEEGVGLLGKNAQYHVEDTIKAFIEKIEGDRKRLNPIDRGYDRPFHINLGTFGTY